MPTIVKRTPSGVVETTDPPDGGDSLIRLPDGEIYYFNGLSWVGASGDRIVLTLNSNVLVNSAVIVSDSVARLASASTDYVCSGICTYKIDETKGVIASTGRVYFPGILPDVNYFLGENGEVTTTPDLNNNIVLIGSGEQDNLLLKLGQTTRK